MKNVARLSEIWSKHHRRLYLVGGVVRDLLLARGGQDIDLTTDAPPAETRRMAVESHPDSIYTVGEKFGTVGLIFGEQRIEITTFRAEWYDPGSRKPHVQFGSSLVEDLARRDFTINAMAQDTQSGELVDPFNGRADLAAHVMRAVGKPEERFAEDPLRLLRGVRFAVQLGFTIEKETTRAMKADASLIAQVSKERIADEINKILLSPDPARGIRMLVDLGLAQHILPEVLPMRRVEQEDRRYKDVFEHTMRVLDRIPADLALRWAALLHDVGKPTTVRWEEGEIHFPGHERVGEEMARSVLSRLRMDRETIGRVGKMVGMHMRVNLYSADWTDGAVRRLMREAGDELDELFALSRADITSHRPRKVSTAVARVAELEERVQRIREEENIAALTSPLDGHELMTMFERPPGRWIQEVKDYLLNLVLEGQLAADDKGRATELARAFVDQHSTVDSRRERSKTER